MPEDYPLSLIPIIIRDLGYEIAWTPVRQADILVYGPFFRKTKPYRWLPKPLRPVASQLYQTRVKRQYQPITLFQTSENIRNDFISADYSISFDISYESTQFRMPYWMEMVDWSQEGITGNTNPRFGKLLSIDQMMQPLGNEFLTRNRKAALITSHLGEPRKTLYVALSKIIPIDGYGPYFNNSIKYHHQSGLKKWDILQNYAFNLCPENGSYPGYYTEKIPEAFLSGCLPLAWANTNIAIDFNPLAMINLESMMWNQFEGLAELLQDKNQLLNFAEQPLLLREPSIEPLKRFIQQIVEQATS